MRFTSAMLAALMSVAGHDGAVACGYHSALTNAAFDVVHPKSLGVVVAIRHAKERGLLEDGGATRRAIDLFGAGYRRAVEDLEALEGRLARTAPRDSNRFALVLVGPRLWSNFAVSDNRATVEIHAAPAAAEETIVLSDEDVLHALVNARLSFDVAIEQGLLRIVNDPEGRTAALLAAALTRHS